MMIDVTIKVDEERIAEFYAMYANWLEAGSPTPLAQTGERRPWGSDDLEEAKHVWSKMGSPAQSLFRVLLQSRDPVPWQELAEALGPDAEYDTVYGSFGWPARLAKEMGRTHPVKSKKTQEGQVYWLDPVVRTVFGKVMSGSGAEAG